MIQIALNFKSALPLYEQMKEQLRLLILSGTLPPGDQLPPIRQLAVQLNVNPNTVAKVYRELEQQGFLENRQGKGCFVPPELPVSVAGERFAIMRREVRQLMEKGRALGFSPSDTIRLIEELEHE